MKVESPQVKQETDAASSVSLSGTSTPINISTTLTPSLIRVGCKCYVEKDGEKRLAEILGTRVRKDALEFYVHYNEFNKVCCLFPRSQVFRCCALGANIDICVAFG